MTYPAGMNTAPACVWRICAGDSRAFVVNPGSIVYLRWITPLIVSRTKGASRMTDKELFPVLPVIQVIISPDTKNKL